MRRIAPDPDIVNSNQLILIILSDHLLGVTLRPGAGPDRLGVLMAPADLPPTLLVNLEGLDPLVGDANESPMDIQFAVPE